MTSCGGLLGLLLLGVVLNGVPLCALVLCGLTIRRIVRSRMLVVRAGRVARVESDVWQSWTRLLIGLAGTCGAIGWIIIDDRSHLGHSVVYTQADYVRFMFWGSLGFIFGYALVAFVVKFWGEMLRER